MKTTRLGRTNLMVSALGFGGIPIIPLPMEDGISVVRHVYERGITFFDSAFMYVSSEQKIGQALKDVRNKIVLATKTMERDAESAAAQIETSLQNFQIDYIDLYQLHNVIDEEILEKVLAPGGAYEAAARAKEEGKIRHIGFTSHDVATAVKACRTERFDTVQVPFNFIESEPADELFKVAQDLDMGMIAMKPLGGGLLERVELCIRFLQQYPDVVAIPGVSTVKDADEIIELYLEPKPLSEDDLKEIEGIRSELGDRFCHRCGYCLPCEQGVRIPEIMYFRSVMRTVGPQVAIHFVKAAMESAEECAECGECLEKCPYSLPIPEMLQDNLALYKDMVSKNL